jgi:peptide/nickel transport system substrate-binding protein
MKTNKTLAAVVIGAVAVAAVAALFFLVWKPEPKGIMVGSSSLPDSLNPVLEQNTAGLNADELLFDGLVNFEVDPVSGKLYSEFALAETIEQDPASKRIYRATLKDAVWHDGKPVTAEDVAFSFRAYAEPDNRSPSRDYIVSFIKDRSVEIEFHKPIPEFRAYPVLSFKIIPSTYKGEALSPRLRSGENERAFATEPVGSGPYKFSGWEIGKWVSFEANEAYFKKRPAADTVIVKKIIDPVIRMNEFRKGRVNLILEISPVDRQKAERVPGAKITSFLPYAFYQVNINAKSRSFSNPDARAALSMALDRAALVPGVTDSEAGAVLNTGLFPSDIFSSNMPEYVDKPMPDYAPRDIGRAKALAESGGIEGKSAILLYPDSMGEFGESLAKGLVDQFAGIGLTVEAKRTGDQVFKRLVFDEKDYDLALTYNDGFDNLYSSIGEWYRSKGRNNVSGISDVKLDKLFDAWDKAVVMQDWVKLTLAIHQRVAELSPAAYLCKLRKDVYSRGIKSIAIASDNPFLSVEDWSFGR